MRRGERKGAEGPRPGSPVPVGKASLEEPLDGAAAGRASGPAAGRRSTESEVYDDGTNTFFWTPGPAPCCCNPDPASPVVQPLISDACALSWEDLAPKSPQKGFSCPPWPQSPAALRRDPFR
ncbi:hypothetical protein J1605_002299 [Eschrichtius robustus]|uniref:Uncharacterized protein n=1 Tax=Eschrichtius robustus TaxID=9764 RepID=A0AB34HUP6_ESCRO|nr:hypothetical protein J1605_002299 [Eschrichtius robustus]